jgi:hypothetical protein
MVMKAGSDSFMAQAAVLWCFRTFNVIRIQKVRNPDYSLDRLIDDTRRFNKTISIH